MTKTKTMRGTCPACFKEFDVDDGRMHRHGWQESGGRQVGVYGQAMHVGECFGVGWKPFEVSPEGTWAFLSKVVFPHALRNDAALQRYRTRPTLQVRYDFDTGERTSRYGDTRKEMRFAELEPGQTLTVDAGVNVLGRPKTRSFDYEKELAYRISSTERELEATKAEGLRLIEVASNWKPGKLRAKKAKGPTVHFKREGARSVFCSSRSHYLTTSSNADEVTCSRCRKALDAEAARKAEREAEKDDAETLFAHLQEHGPQAQKAIKKALGWDTKRFNKALDREWRGQDRIGRVYSTSPNQFEVKAPRKAAGA